MPNTFLTNNLGLVGQKNLKRKKYSKIIKNSISYAFLGIYLAISLAILFTLDKFLFGVKQSTGLTNVFAFDNTRLYFESAAQVTKAAILFFSIFLSLYFMYALFNKSYFKVKHHWWLLGLYAVLFIVSIGLYFGFEIKSWKDVFGVSFLFLILAIINLFGFIFVKTKELSINLDFYKKRVFNYLSHTFLILLIVIGIGMLGGLSFNDQPFDLIKANFVQETKTLVANKVYDEFNNLAYTLNHPGYAVLLFVVISLLITFVVGANLVFIVNFKNALRWLKSKANIFGFAIVIFLAVFFYFSVISFNDNKENLYRSFMNKESFDLVYVNIVFSILAIILFITLSWFKSTKNWVQKNIFNIFFAVEIIHWLITYLLIANQTNEEQNFILIWLSALTLLINFANYTSITREISQRNKIYLSIFLMLIVIIMSANAANEWLTRYQNDLQTNHYLTLWNATFIPLMVCSTLYTIVYGLIYFIKQIRTYQINMYLKNER
ncbi:hypothetical protein OF377_00270 [Ureaplasma sp. ES3154-GEN]|uniref:MSC_0624 family F1-like ATPase-associated membrane protein n=1 Tax=Ureaplasma sp. ES3154-GEN TaxID=2984844 RepID=UPI0021E86206|nr:hypothetical protein [Ureaplasma sp. ES3154-GEN]MCV3743323.1 hypothetical protein [Ureaplasma sp. ES3154-GEN]